jgi:hypothetical protein
LRHVESTLDGNTGIEVVVEVVVVVTTTMDVTTDETSVVVVLNIGELTSAPGGLKAIPISSFPKF